MDTVVYTAILNNKDIIQPMPKDRNVKYVCFSDRKFNNSIWEYRPIEPLGQKDPRRIARRYKILSHIYFPGCRTIWVDGRIRLNKMPSQMFNQYTTDLSVRLHGQRNCIYQEAEQVKKINYDDPVIVDRQMEYISHTGYPEYNGLHETGCILRRPTEAVERFNEAWWSMLSTGSKRDQLSFDFIAWREGKAVEEMHRNDVRVLRHQKVTNVNS